jgi:hypothetical protein
MRYPTETDTRSVRCLVKHAHGDAARHGLGLHETLAKPLASAESRHHVRHQRATLDATGKGARSRPLATLGAQPTCGSSHRRTSSPPRRGSRVACAALYASLGAADVSIP